MKDVDSSLTKVPPHNLEAEQAVLGGILLENTALHVVNDLEPSDFYPEAHRIIFQAFLDLEAKKGPMDTISLLEELRAQGKLDKAGGALYLSQLLDNTATAANIEYYSNIVKNKSIYRKLISITTDLREKAYRYADESPEEIVGEALRAIIDIAPTGKKADFADPKELVKRTFALIEERFRNKNSLIGISSGFTELDKFTGGLQKSELIIIAGRPGMGKTSLAMNISENVSLSKIPVGVFSLEMPEEGLMMRMIASQGRLDSRNIKRGKIADSEWAVLTHVASNLASAPIYINDRPGLTINQISMKARRLQIEKGLGLLVVDYITLVKGIRREKREREIAEISEGLKSLAKELEIPVIACAQLNRQVEQRPDKRPIMSDLRESGSIEQDADLILFLYRDEIYNKDPNNPQRGLAEVNIGKQRNGPLGMFKLVYNSKSTRFYNWHNLEA